MELEALLEQLDETEIYDKENVLIDIFCYLYENEVKQNDGIKLFMELSKLRDRSLMDGSESYFEDNEDPSLILSLLKQVSEYSVFNQLKRLCQDCQYDEIDEWIMENEWLLDDELAVLIKKSIS